MPAWPNQIYQIADFSISETTFAWKTYESGWGLFDYYLAVYLDVIHPVSLYNSFRWEMILSKDIVFSLDEDWIITSGVERRFLDDNLWVDGRISASQVYTTNAALPTQFVYEGTYYIGVRVFKDSELVDTSDPIMIALSGRPDPDLTDYDAIRNNFVSDLSPYDDEQLLQGTSEIDTVTFDGFVLSSIRYLSIRDQDSVVLFDPDEKIVLSDIERLVFENGTIALDIAGNAGEVYRMYQAAYDRKPDIPGLSFWVQGRDAGLSLYDIATSFLSAQESVALYGASPSNFEFINAMYMNVLDREADTDGFAFWLAQMQAGLSREDILQAFSESQENQLNVIGSIKDGILLDVA